jgi:mono/diheme cytochrome c family protein
MRKVVRWLGLALGGLLSLVILTSVVLGVTGGARLHQTRDIQAEAITIPDDEAALARGEHLVEVMCAGSCHGDDLSGQVMFESPVVGAIYTANITVVGQTHTDADLVRAIRHAVGQDGRQLVFMPAEMFVHLSAEDLGAVIGYLKTVPPVEHVVPEPRLTFLGRILLAMGLFGEVFSAEYIDHDQPFPAMPVIGANVEYGEYLARLCAICHGADLAGGQPVFDPQSPPAPSLTAGGRLALYSEDGFIQTLRTGVTPYNYELDPLFMPWEDFGRLDDDELRAIWLYLQSLPPD